MDYRLVKVYPNSPELGTVYNKESFIGDYGVDPNFEEYPDFWEKVIVKDYEILTFRHKLSKNLLHLHGDKKYANKTGKWYVGQGELSENECLAMEIHYEIHSVKRLSDGEVFTIGDKIKGYKGDEEPFIIKYITLKSEIDISLSNYDLRENCGKGKRSTALFNNGTHFAEKVKPSLFTTEDGVDIFEGDHIYLVGQNFKQLYFFVNENIKYSVGKRFSTKEKAEEYILMNKPCLSLNDVYTTFSNHWKWSEDLKKLVKSKL